ncbi:MAG: hypothetical protein H0T62_04095 [Parachlamydiaceae bacterium]|nr:hypothetical protein [Parachlamydiaceae bacterium]
MLHDSTLITGENFNNSYHPLPFPLNDVNLQKDKFERKESLTQIQKTVNDSFAKVNCLKNIIDLNISNIEESNVVGCRALTAQSLQSVKKQIQNFEKMNENSCIMPLGSTCKKIDAKTDLTFQNKRFENIFEDLVNVELFAKNLTAKNCMEFTTENFVELKLDLEKVKNKIDLASHDFIDIEIQTLNVLARLGPTKRNSETKGISSTALYREILNLYSKIALTKNQFEIHLFNLAARIELLQPGKVLTEKLENEVKILHDFKNNPDNVENKGLLKYTYIKKEKENLFAAIVKKVRENFTNYTLEAILYKARLQEFLDKKATILGEQYSKDLAFGETEQEEINAKIFVEGDSVAKSFQKELLNNINEIWLKISTAQSKLYTKLNQAEIAIQTKSCETSEMYFNSETLTAWKMDRKDLLNSNVLYREEGFK